MNLLRVITSFTATVGICAFALSPIHAQSTSISANFTRTSPGESIVAPYTAASGTASLVSYGGLVEVNVSGMGFALGPTVSDAFYFLNGAPVGAFYGLNIGFTGRPFAGGQPNNIQNFIVFIESLGAVSPGTIPAFNAQNSYRFVLDLPTNAGPLSFGVSDGAYQDNGGQYDLQIFPVTAGVAAPEPGTLALVTMALLSLAVRPHRAKKN